MLTSGIKVGSNTSWESAFMNNPSPGDDGWFIDDVTVTDALTVPGEIVPDMKDNSGLPTCGVTCNQVTAALELSPTVTDLPGRIVELDASSSTFDRCVDGALQYRFWRDDELLRDFTDVPTLIDAPQSNVIYAVDVRCSSATSCADATSAAVTVACPSSGTARLTLTAPDRDTLRGNGPATHYVVGDLGILDGTYATFAGFVLDPAAPRVTIDISVDDASGGLWYLARGLCNTGFWSSQEPSESGGDRNASLP